MKTASRRDWDSPKPKTQTYNEIIYLYEYPEERRTDARRPDARRRSAGRGRRGGDIFWNVFFGAMCLSVLAVLFLH
jgi:hypothetical protein